MCFWVRIYVINVYICNKFYNVLLNIFSFNNLFLYCFWYEFIFLVGGIYKKIIVMLVLLKDLKLREIDIECKFYYFLLIFNFMDIFG